MSHAASMSQMKRLENTFVKVVIGLIKLSVLIIATFFMMIAAAFMVEIFTTDPVHYTAKTLIEHELGLKKYKLKKAYHEYSFGETRGDWWVELEQGFDIKKIKESKQFTNHYIQADRPDTSEEVGKILLLKWGYQNALGYESYYAENTVIGNDTLCNERTIRNCQVSVYAKDGDKNLFIYISIW